MTGHLGVTGPAPAVRARTWWLGLVGGLLCLAAAVLTIGGTFGQVFSVGFHGQRNVSIATTMWSIESSVPGIDEDPLFANNGAFSGVPVVIAGGVLALAGILALVATAAPYRGLMTTVRVLAGVGFGALTGIMTLVWIGVVHEFDLFTSDLFSGGSGMRVDTSTGTGLLLMTVGTGISAIGLATVVTRLRDRSAVAARFEPPTPPMGVPLARPAPAPEAPAEPSVLAPSEVADVTRGT